MYKEKHIITLAKSSFAMYILYVIDSMEFTGIKILFLLQRGAHKTRKFVCLLKFQVNP